MAKENIIIIGDLNAEPNYDSIKKLEQFGMRSVFNLQKLDYTTYKIRNEVEKRIIDYIFYKGNLFFAEEIDINDEKSESEPSVDNLDKNQIMRLMPINGKKRKRRKNKFKKFEKKKDNKNKDLDIELFNPIKEAAKKLEEEKRKN